MTPVASRATVLEKKIEAMSQIQQDHARSHITPETVYASGLSCWPQELVTRMCD